MRPFKRFVAILAFVAFLLTGGTGAGAQMILCTDAAGQVRLETPFNRCCEDASQKQNDPEPLVSVASSEFFGSGDCGPCSDAFIALGQEHIVTVRPHKVASAEHQLHVPVLVIEPALADSDRLDAGVGRAPPWALVPAHRSVETIVLRC